MTTTDVDLIARARCQDTEAFCELVQKYRERLVRSISRMAHGPTEAEDVVQDTFCKAFCHLDQFRRECGFYTWLYGIARNCCISRHRKRHPVSLPTGWPETAGQEPVDSAPSPPQLLILAEQIHQIRVALNELPDHFRTILILRECEGLDYATIAQMLDIEAGTVRSRLYRARQTLRARFEHLSNRSRPFQK